VGLDLSHVGVEREAHACDELLCYLHTSSAAAPPVK
jgi:hypothetical protein